MYQILPWQMTGILLVTLTLVSCAKENPVSSTSLDGKWLCRGDYVVIFYFRGDGDFAMGQPGQPPQSSFGTWRIEGHCLIISNKKPNGSTTEERGLYRLAGDKFEWDRPIGEKTFTQTFTRMR